MKSNWKSFLVVFLIGLLTGSALMMLKPGHHDRGGRRGEHHVDRMMSHLKRDLQLTPDQQLKVRGILENSHRQMKRAWCSLKPKFEAVRTATSGEIRAVLTPEQLEKFEAVEKKMKTRHEKRGKKGRKFDCDELEKKPVS